MDKVTVTTKNSYTREIKQKELLEGILEKYDCPVFTDKVIIEFRAMSRSHPVLTLNTQYQEPNLILKTYIHEQFHWFAESNSTYKECIEYLKTKYNDNGECNKTGEYPNSFWEHIIVCWNTRNFLKQYFSEGDLDYVYNMPPGYPLTEKLIKQYFENIRNDLYKFNMEYKKPLSK